MKKEKLDIVYEDKYLLCVNKKNNLLCVSTDKEKEKTLFHEVYEYIKKQNKNDKVFIIHRLDRDTSGLVLFAKNEKTKLFIQNNWENVIRKYYAIVNGKMEKAEDTLQNYLSESSTFNVYVSNKYKGKLAITKYKKIKNTNRYSLLDIDIKTGRKNQIRVQLNNINHSIVGDKKYGNATGKIERLYLHAYYLEFIHPVTKKVLIINTLIPKEFNKLVS